MCHIITQCVYYIKKGFKLCCRELRKTESFSAISVMESKESWAGEKLGNPLELKSFFLFLAFLLFFSFLFLSLLFEIFKKCVQCFACIYVLHHVYALLKEAREGQWLPWELELQRVVSRHVGTGIRTAMLLAAEPSLPEKEQRFFNNL